MIFSNQEDTCDIHVGSLIGRIIISMGMSVSVSEKGMIAIELNVHAHSIAVSLIEVIIATLYATACCPNIDITCWNVKEIAKGMPLKFWCSVLNILFVYIETDFQTDTFHLD